MSDTMPELTMKNIRPFWNRCTVTDGLVEEQVRDSGLVVPIAVASEQFPEFHRGLLLEVSAENFADAEQLTPGTVVFFTDGVKIGDVWVVELTDILAFEA